MGSQNSFRYGGMVCKNGNATVHSYASYDGAVY